MLGAIPKDFKKQTKQYFSLKRAYFLQPCFRHLKQSVSKTTVTEGSGDVSQHGGSGWWSRPHHTQKQEVSKDLLPKMGQSLLSGTSLSPVIKSHLVLL